MFIYVTYGDVQYIFEDPIGKLYRKTIILKWSNIFASIGLFYTSCALKLKPNSFTDKIYL